jgi:hypothetical protein
LRSLSFHPYLYIFKCHVCCAGRSTGLFGPSPLAPAVSRLLRAHHIWNAIHLHLTVVGRSEITNLNARTLAGRSFGLFIAAPWRLTRSVDSFQATPTLHRLPHHPPLIEYLKQATGTPSIYPIYAGQNARLCLQVMIFGIPWPPDALRVIAPPLEGRISRVCQRLSHYHSTYLYIFKLLSAVQVGPFGLFGPSHLAPRVSRLLRAHHIWCYPMPTPNCCRKGLELTEPERQNACGSILWPLYLPHPGASHSVDSFKATPGTSHCLLSAAFLVLSE